MARITRRTDVNECRRCATFCDRVIHPSACVAASCPALYSYDDPLTQRRYMGCLHKVFGVEIDVEMFNKAERTRAGFGAVKLANAPLRRCQFSVERAFDSSFDESACSNKRFFDWPEAGADAISAFDLRDRI